MVYLGLRAVVLVLQTQSSTLGLIEVVLDTVEVVLVPLTPFFRLHQVVVQSNCRLLRHPQLIL